MGKAASSTLVLGTRGLRVRHRHLLRDLQRLMPHARTGAKLDAETGLRSVVHLCEDADCGAALLLDARDPLKLYLWIAGCPDGPSAMFRVLNVHTVAELKLVARRNAGVRSLLSFDQGFDASAERRVVKALLTRTFSVPREAARRNRAGGSSSAPNIERVKHTLNFTWLDGRIWLRVYRIGRGLDGNMDVEEIGPRLVLQPVRIIASGFGGAILHSYEARDDVPADESDEEPQVEPGVLVADSSADE